MYDTPTSAVNDLELLSFVRDTAGIVLGRRALGRWGRNSDGVSAPATCSFSGEATIDNDEELVARLRRLPDADSLFHDRALVPPR
jgi:hypothetical protein